MSQREEFVTDGMDIAFVRQDRSFKGGKTTVLKVAGADGAVTLAGDKPVLSGAAVFQKTQVGRNGAGSLTLTGARIGDKVVGVVNLSTPGDNAAAFESTITVNDAIQQSSASNLSAVVHTFTLVHQTPANS